jgi:Homeodomain-like domain
MDRLGQLIEETTDVRELKRALSVKLREGGMATEAVGEVLQVTPRAVRAWCQRYEREGVEGLRVRYRGSESYLKLARKSVGGSRELKVSAWYRAYGNQPQARFPRRIAEDSGASQRILC